MQVLPGPHQWTEGTHLCCVVLVMLVVVAGAVRRKAVAKQRPASAVVLFDGICVMCNGFVSFCIDRDPNKLLRFAALESLEGRKLRANHGLSDPPRSFVLIADGHACERSTAAIQTLSMLSPAPWAAFSIFLWVPRLLRDPIYDLGWLTRRQLFGTTEVYACRTPDNNDRFL
jgi:predicted DCC family thiol-disulfide oxidoreductase YuxK